MTLVLIVRTKVLTNTFIYGKYINLWVIQS